MRNYRNLSFLFALLITSGCVGIHPSRKYDCRITPGYAESAIDSTTFDITLYYASYWSEQFTATALAQRALKLCGNDRYSISKSGVGVEYLDGCFGPGDASGEQHYLLKCN